MPVISNTEKIYPNTSAIIPYYFKELVGVAAQSVFATINALSISELRKIEFVTASQKKFRIGDVSEGEIKKALLLFKNHQKQSLYKIVNFDSRYFEAVGKIITQSESALRSLDAIHLGVVQAEEYKLFSFDKTMIRAAKEFNIPVIKP